MDELELVRPMLVPCSGCNAMWLLDQECPLCNEGPIKTEEKEYEQSETWRLCND